MVRPPLMNRLPNTQSQPCCNVSQYRTTSRQSSDSSAIIRTTASPFISSKPATIARPNPCGAGLCTGLTTGMRFLISLTISHVRSTLPSSTTMISWRTLFNRSSTCRCSTVQAMQASSSRAGITTVSNVRGFLSIDFYSSPDYSRSASAHQCGATDCPPYGAFFSWRQT